MTAKSAQTHQNISDIPLKQALSERYLSYALSTIMSRSLPDVRDGLKPVHRRLLYAMYQLQLRPQNPPKKSARVVGDVIGKFHPHGDQAVYDAMVRLAQDFAVRYPLIDGQGNFGSIDGDNPAAMRYTESRLTDVALYLLEGIDEDAIDFRETYDGEDKEPVVLPARFPNLLANGASGIAVGMATNIPPHNIIELFDALLLLIDKDADTDELMSHIKGPDFPTGGVLVEPPENIREAYNTGRGSFRLRARWHKEDLKQGQYQIVVTEIPYQVQKSKLVEKIAELVTARKISMLDDVRDESAEDVRLVIVPRNRNVEAGLLMEALFRHCDLEIRVPLNMNVLDAGTTPGVMPLKAVLRSWLDHRQDVLIRRSRHRLEKVKNRLEVLDGYLIVYLNIDDVIRIIREEDEPKAELMRFFKLTDMQAEAVLNMRLRALRKLEEMEIRKEYDALAAEKDTLEQVLGSESLKWKKIKEDIQELKKTFASDLKRSARRTDLADAPAPAAVDIEEAIIEKEPVTVICSSKGWIRAMKGHGIKHNDVKFKEGDRGRFFIEAYTTDKLLVFATNGRFYTLGCDKLPPGRGFGEPLRLSIDLPNESDIVSIQIFRPEIKLLVARSDGRGFAVNAQDVLAQTKAGKTVLTTDSKAEAELCRVVMADHDMVAVTGENRKMLIFPLDEIPVMNRGKGVILMRFKDGGISDVKIFRKEEGLCFPYGNGERILEDITPWLGKRAQTGRMAPNGFPKNNRFE